MVLPNSGSAWKQILERRMLVGKESLLFSAGWQPGEKMASCPTINSKDSTQPRKFFKGESFGKGHRVFVFFHCVKTFFWLVAGEVTGRSSWNLVLSLKLPSSTWVPALVFAEELKDIVMYIPWGGTRTLPQGCTIFSWLLLLCFCIPSLLWLAAVWICLLELREGQGGWMKPISYK